MRAEIIHHSPEAFNLADVKDTADSVDRHLRIRSKVQTPPEVKKWWLLSNFDIEGEIDCLFKIWDQKQKEGLDRKLALDEGLKEVRGNLIGFKLEFLMQEAMLPNPVAQNREGRLINAISGQRILPMISTAESQGAVYDSFASIENFFQEAPNGSMALFASPQGHSGLRDSFNREINYPDHQTYMFRKNEQGSMEAFTVVSDMTPSQTVDFLELLGADRTLMEVGQTEIEKRAAIIRNSVFFPPILQGKTYQFKDIIAKMQTVMGTEIVRTVEQPVPGTNQKRIVKKSFTEVYSKLSQGEKLLNLDSDCERVVGGFEEFTREALDLLPRDFIRDNIEIKLRDTIIEMYMSITGSTAANLDGMSRQKIYQMYAGSISMIAGCSGGGMGGGFMETPFGARAITIESSSGYSKGDCIKCRREEVEVGPCKICKKCEN